MRLFTGHLVSSDPADSPFTQANPSANRVPIYIASGTLSASVNTNAVDIGHLEGVSVTCFLSGAAAQNLTGTVGVYGSNDLVPSPIIGTGSLPSHWCLMQDKANVNCQQQITGSQSLMFNINGQYARWLRVQYVHTQGSGSLDVWLTGKGAH
jgi:hypothetical protein